METRRPLLKNLKRKEALWFTSVFREQILRGSNKHSIRRRVEYDKLESIPTAHRPCRISRFVHQEKCSDRGFPSQRTMRLLVGDQICTTPSWAVQPDQGFAGAHWV